MNEIQKNILDLKHSVNLAKAGAFLGLAFSSWIAIFFGVKEFYSDSKLAFFVSTIVFILFLYKTRQFFKKCEHIHSEISKIKSNQ